MALDVQAVAQSQRAEFVVGQLAAEIARDLVAELRDPFIDHALVESRVAVHLRSPPDGRRPASALPPAAREAPSRACGRPAGPRAPSPAPIRPAARPGRPSSRYPAPRARGRR